MKFTTLVYPLNVVCFIPLAHCNVVRDAGNTGTLPHSFRSTSVTATSFQLITLRSTTTLNKAFTAIPDLAKGEAEIKIPVDDILVGPAENVVKIPVLEPSPTTTSAGEDFRAQSSILGRTTENFVDIKTEEQITVTSAAASEDVPAQPPTTSSAVLATAEIKIPDQLVKPAPTSPASTSPLTTVETSSVGQIRTSLQIKTERKLTPVFLADIIATATVGQVVQLIGLPSPVTLGDADFGTRTQAASVLTGEVKLTIKLPTEENSESTVFSTPTKPVGQTGLPIATESNTQPVVTTTQSLRAFTGGTTAVLIPTVLPVEGTPPPDQTIPFVTETLLASEPVFTFSPSIGSPIISSSSTPTTDNPTSSSKALSTPTQTQPPITIIRQPPIMIAQKSGTMFINNTPFTFTESGNDGTMTINGTTTTLSQQNSPSQKPKKLILTNPTTTNTYLISEIVETGVIIAEQTLMPGRSVTVDGTVMRLASGGTGVVIGEMGRATQGIDKAVETDVAKSSDGVGASVTGAKKDNAGASMKAGGVVVWSYIFVHVICGFLNG